MIIGALAGALAIGVSHGGAVCGDSQEVRDHLAKKYAEYPSGAGIMPSGEMAVVYVSESGTWTIVIRRPNGMSCLVATGDAWGDLDPPEAIGDPT